jgi:hypothetical protein
MRDLVDARAPRPIWMSLAGGDEDQCRVSTSLHRQQEPRPIGLQDVGYRTSRIPQDESHRGHPLHIEEALREERRRGAPLL